MEDTNQLIYNLATRLSEAREKKKQTEEEVKNLNTIIKEIWIRRVKDMIKFMIGMFIGSTVGFFTAALFVVNRREGHYELW